MYMGQSEAPNKTSDKTNDKNCNETHIEREGEGEILWKRFYQKLRLEIPKQFFDVFFQDLEVVVWNNEELLIESADAKVIAHIGNRYIQIMTTLARQMSAPGVTVKLRIKDPSQSRNKTVQGMGQNTVVPRSGDGSQMSIFDAYRDTYQSPSQNPSQRPFMERVDKRGGLASGGGVQEGFEKLYVNPGYTFERFVKGPSNEHALAAALGAAENPMKYHNPLYLYGGVGLGKTHLLMAIANHIQNNFPWLKVRYVSSEVFQSDLVEAFAQKTLPLFKAKYRDIDVLLIDDIQFVSARAEYTQETIFHIFNYLYQNNKQIVISGDRPPQQLSKLKDRLVSRFQSGLIVDIKPPEMETREAIIRKRAAEMELELPDESVRWIAMNIRDQVRLLEASLIRLKFATEYEGSEAGPALTKRVLGDIKDSAKEQKVDPAQVVEAVSREFHVAEDEIFSKSRMERISLARHVAMYLIRKLIPSYSLLKVAEIFGRNDHTTVLNAQKKIERILEQDQSFRAKLEEVTEQIKMAADEKGFDAAS